MYNTWMNLEGIMQNEISLALLVKDGSANFFPKHLLFQLHMNCLPAL